MLFLGQSVKEAVDAQRLHHKLEPMEIMFEDGVTKVDWKMPNTFLYFSCSGWLMVLQGLVMP